jgi:hypothetical protein
MEKHILNIERRIYYKVKDEEKGESMDFEISYLSFFVVQVEGKGKMPRSTLNTFRLPIQRNRE